MRRGVSDELKVLALDSATEACSVALFCNGDIQEEFAIIERGHAEHLLPMTEMLLEKAAMQLNDVDLFAFGAGPGSFTGLRIGAAMVQGLALATGKPVIPVSSLAALAARHTGHVLALIDARMGQVYHGFFSVGENGIPIADSTEGVDDPSALFTPDAPTITVIGSGWDRYKDEVSAVLGDGMMIREAADEFPHAADIARLALHEFRHGRAVEAAQALPHYVRDNVARKMGE